MYMDSRADLGYWSTETCFLKWSLRTGTIIIGLMTMLSQSALVAVGVMAIISCPYNDTDTVEYNSTLDTNTEVFEKLEKRSTETDCEKTVVNVTLALPLVRCPLLPRPVIESLGITADTLLLVVSLFLVYCIIYFILSFWIFVAAIKRSSKLVHCWVGFTGFHMVVILFDLLYTLAFTTLVLMCTSITLFVVVLYTWAVVKSYMITVRNEKLQPPTPEEKDTNDYTVDGIDMDQIPVQV